MRGQWALQGQCTNAGRRRLVVLNERFLSRLLFSPFAFNEPTRPLHIKFCLCVQRYLCCCLTIGEEALWCSLRAVNECTAQYWQIFWSSEQPPVCLTEGVLDALLPQVDLI